MSMEYIDSSFCPFCEWYNALKSRDKYYEDGRDGRSCVTEFKYGAALVHETYYDGMFSGCTTYDPQPAQLLPDLWEKVEQMSFENAK